MCLQIDVHYHHLQALLEDYLKIVLQCSIGGRKCTIFYLLYNKTFYQCLVKAFLLMCDDVLNIGAKSGS